MNYRTAKVLAAQDLGAAGTKTIDINLKDIVSRLTLIWKPVKSKEGMDAPLYQDIPKIELVDGSDVLFSMDGGEAQALNIYDRKCPTMLDGMIINALAALSIYGIDFGRKLYDPELALDPTKFRNLQLKVTWDENVADTGCEENTLEVIAECFDEKVVSPVGFLMSKEHWSGAKPLSGYEYIDLPTDFPIRKMLLKAYKAAYAPYQLVDQARIDEDNEKRIPFDWTDLEDYLKMMKNVWTPVEELLVGYGKGEPGYIYYMTPTEYNVAPLLTSTAAAAAATINLLPPMKGGKITVYANGTEPFTGRVTGYLPNHCFEFPFGDQMDLADWYDVTKLGSCRLRLEAGATDVEEAAVVLQQLRRY